MPNWCENVAVIWHPDKRKIKRLVQAFQGPGLMQEFYPCPQDLLDTRAGAYHKGDPEYAGHIQKQKDNEAKYGHPDWFGWKDANWGTKWDVKSEHCSQVEMATCGHTVTLKFDSAWSPPINFYSYMEVEHGFKIDAYYFEGGIGFCGQWRGGNDDFYDVPDTSDEVVAKIPAMIDEMFAISEHMSDCESEQEEEEEDDDDYEEDEEDEEEDDDNEDEDE